MSACLGEKACGADVRWCQVTALSDLPLSLEWVLSRPLTGMGAEILRTSGLAGTAYVSGMLHSCTKSKVHGAEQPYHSSQLRQIAQYRRVQSFVLSLTSSQAPIMLETHRIRVD